MFYKYPSKRLLSHLLGGAERIDSTVKAIETGEAHEKIVMIVMSVMLMTD